MVYFGELGRANPFSERNLPKGEFSFWQFVVRHPAYKCYQAHQFGNKRDCRNRSGDAV
jgi:hypothetical protein